MSATTHAWDALVEKFDHTAVAGMVRYDNFASWTRWRSAISAFRSESGATTLGADNIVGRRADLSIKYSIGTLPRLGKQARCQPGLCVAR